MRNYYFYSDNLNDPDEISVKNIDTVKFGENDTLKIMIHGVKGDQFDNFNVSIRNGKHAKEYFIQNGLENIFSTGPSPATAAFVS